MQTTLKFALLGLLAGSLPLSAQIDIDSYTFGGLSARALGPATMSGRIAALDAVEIDGKLNIYVGAASGGVWKSSNAGITFEPVFDDHSQSIGAIRIDPSSSDTIWVGTGEPWVRNSVSVGTGVYRSSDAGKTWQSLGLEQSEHISAIEVSSDDSDTVFVCALGQAWSANAQRGVYRSSDAGANWEQVLYVDDNTGCGDLVMDPSAPNILYAGMWDFRRSPDFFRSGGPGSGLYRSLDGGDSWQRLEQGLPEGELGRIALAIAPSRTSVVYANVESADTALYRSDDFGHSWQRMSDASNVQMRPFYFGELMVDPTDHERVYRPAFTTSVSEDGGNSFTSLFGSGFGVGIHPDHHAMWINPDNPQQVLLGTDGGLYISHDRSNNWNFARNLPISQFYHVSHDQQIPYQVYGGLQDNGSWAGPSRGPGGVTNADWDNVGFGDGFWVAVDPFDDNIVYSEYQGGKLMRINRSLSEVKSIAPIARDDESKLRFNWNTPLHLSRATPGTIYYGSQYLHRSTDRGESWQTISPDLTSNDPQRQRQLESGGITIDNSTAENNTTLYTISASPLDAGLIWVGSDDGLVHVTRNGGEDWDNVTGNIPDLPAGTWISRVEASPHDPGTAFLTADGHRSGDMNVYVYRTTDYGQSWTSLASDDINGYVWVIRQDLENPQLLFVGTEFGLFISLDGGQRWARFQENLPPVAVHDISIHERDHDLILATHGRGIYIIDDITPLRALSAGIIADNVALLPSRPGIMYSGGALQSFGGNDEFIAQNPPEAAMISYYLKKRHLLGDLKINVYDSNDQLITSLPGDKRRGINRVAWPMRLKPPKFPAATSLVPGFVGPRLPEGSYRIELIKGKQTLNSSVELVPDPRSPHSAEDRQLQQQVTLELYNTLADLTYMLDSVDELAAAMREQADELSGSNARDLKRIADRLDEHSGTLAVREGGFISGQERLRERLGELYGDVSGYDGRPTDTQLERQQQLLQQLATAQTETDKLLEQQLPRANRILQRNNIEPLQRISRADWNEREGIGAPNTAGLSKWFIRQQLPALLQLRPFLL
ncbi:MAG: glycosyl hydrolase [Gammaproteobacteria bacterium]|nr:glycosyl hydrolase [Gammaproteobacteria bacterium]